MSYALEYTDHAQAELEEAYKWIEERSSQAAQKWLRDLISRVSELSDHPLRHPMAPEDARFQRGIRLLLFRKKRSQFRIYYTVTQSRVVILSVRSSLRKPLEAGDLPGLSAFD